MQQFSSHRIPNFASYKRGLPMETEKNSLVTFVVENELKNNYRLFVHSKDNHGQTDMYLTATHRDSFVFK